MRNIGPARGTKVLHLMRPRLIAIADTVVTKYLKVPSGSPVERALALADQIRRIGRTGENPATLARIQGHLGELTFVKSSGVVPSACRILDGLTWMRGSKRYNDLWSVMGFPNP